MIFLEINSIHTSQKCSCYGYISLNNRDKERFLCEACGYFADADVDAAVVIRQRGLKELGINYAFSTGSPPETYAQEAS